MRNVRKEIMNNLDIFNILLEKYLINRTVDVVFEDEYQYLITKREEAYQS